MTEERNKANGDRLSPALPGNNSGVWSLAGNSWRMFRSSLLSALVIAPFVVLSIALPIIGAAAIALAVAIVTMPSVRDVASLSPGGTDGVLLLVGAAVAIAAIGWLCLCGLRAYVRYATSRLGPRALPTES